MNYETLRIAALSIMTGAAVVTTVYLISVLVDAIRYR